MGKLYYTQREIAEIIGEETHTIRYWESCFKELKPRNKNGKRVYTDNKLNLFTTVKHLIRDEKITVTGVKERLANVPNNKQKDDDIIFTREEFMELLQIFQLLIMKLKNK